MRIGAFDIDYTLQAHYVLPEVRAGKARLFRTFHVRNVRGTEKDWLRISAQVHATQMRKKVIRNLPVGDIAVARQLEEGITEDILLDRTLNPGRYSGRILLNDSQGEVNIPFQFDVLDAHIIPTDYARSSLLASYVQEDDMLRGFAAEVLKHSETHDVKTTLQLLYEALQAKHLAYQPPVATKHPDSEQISSMGYVIQNGGSCAELSLLFASLLWVRGLSPVLLLFPDHMAVGCFSEAYLPEYETSSDTEAIWRAIQEGKLTLFESTAVCRHQQLSFEGAINSLQNRLKVGDEGWRLINVKRILRQGEIATLTIPDTVFSACNNCGYPSIVFPHNETQVFCPACNQQICKTTPAVVSPHQSVPTNALYTHAQGVAIMQQLHDVEALEVQIAPAYLGSTVREIAAYALRQSLAKTVFLPDSLTSIGDYAFSRCQNLQSIQLFEGLRQIGAGAFSNSGLKSIHIPGTVACIERLTFAYCEALEQVTIEDGVQHIGERAFYGCPRLLSITIPASVQSIDRNAFDKDCSVFLASEDTRIKR